MRSGWVDARHGLTGEMWLGAVTDAGASLEAIERAVQSLGVGEVRVTYARVRREGRAAAAVRVRPPAQTPHVATVAQVTRLVEFAAVDDAPRERALAVLRRLAVAEAAAHGGDLDAVTFNEVAMLDDLAAIVGTCVGLHDLDVGELAAGPVGLPSPGGRPDPVVAALLADLATTDLDGGPALVTPAGAALLAELVGTSAEEPDLEVEAEGVGAAGRDLSGAGLLRLQVGRRRDGA